MSNLSARMRVLREDINRFKMLKNNCIKPDKELIQAITANLKICRSISRSNLFKEPVNNLLTTYIRNLY